MSLAEHNVAKPPQELNLHGWKFFRIVQNRIGWYNIYWWNEQHHIYVRKASGVSRSKSHAPAEYWIVNVAGETLPTKFRNEHKALEAAVSLANRQKNKKA